MAISANLFTRVNAGNGRKALTWFEKSAGGEPHTAATLAAFTAELGSAEGMEDVETPAANLSAYSDLAALRAATNGDPGIAVSAAGVLSAYTPPAAVTRAARREELRQELARSMSSLAALNPVGNDSLLDYVQNVGVRCYYFSLVDAIIDDETNFGKLLDTAKVADKLFLANYPAQSASNVQQMQMTYRGSEWYAETAPKNTNARRFYEISRSGRAYTVESLTTFASAPALPTDHMTHPDGLIDRHGTAQRDCARWLAEVAL